MKKFLALIMAVLMLLSCANALADVVYTGTQEAFSKTQTSATQQTDVWLQVTADGQIDVTVPLVVVFRTNIDGGTYATDTTYKIVNNSSAAIKVTQVAITDQNAVVTTNGVASNMALVEATSQTVYDQYFLTMQPTDRYNTPLWTTALNIAATASGFTKTDKTYTKTADETQGQGLWRIEKKNDGDTDESPITLSLTTSKLSFVTKKADTTVPKNEYGVKLFTVAYTVKIDDSTNIGAAIEGTGVNGTPAYDYNTAS